MESLTENIGQKETENPQHEMDEHQYPDHMLYFHKPCGNQRGRQREKDVVKVEFFQNSDILLCEQFLLEEHSEYPGRQPEKYPVRQQNS